MRKRNERYDRERGKTKLAKKRPSEQIELRTKSCSLYENKRRGGSVLPPLKEKAKSVFEASNRRVKNSGKAARSARLNGSEVAKAPSQWPFFKMPFSAVFYPASRSLSLSLSLSRSVSLSSLSPWLPPPCRPSRLANFAIRESADEAPFGEERGACWRARESLAGSGGGNLAVGRRQRCRHLRGFCTRRFLRRFRRGRRGRRRRGIHEFLPLLNLKSGAIANGVAGKKLEGIFLSYSQNGFACAVYLGQWGRQLGTRQESGVNR